MRRVWGLLLILILCPSVWAMRSKRPQQFTDLQDTNQLTELNNTLSDTWNITNGRYTLDHITTNPQDTRKGTKGDLVYATFGGNDHLCISTSFPEGMNWTCVNVGTLSTCPGGSDGQVQFNDNGTCGGDSDFTWEKNLNTLSLSSGTVSGTTVVASTIKTTNATQSNTPGASLKIIAANGNGTGTGGAISISTGSPGTNGNGGDFTFTASDAAGTATRGGDVYFFLGAGASSGTGNRSGTFEIAPGGGSGKTQATTQFDVLGPTYTLADGQTITEWDVDRFYAPTFNGVAGGGTETVSASYTMDIVGAPAGSNIVLSDTAALKSETTTISLVDGQTLTQQLNNQFFANTINGVAGGATETVTNAATFYIDAAPSGSNITFTNGPYALWVDAGTSRFDGLVEAQGNLTVTGIIIAGGTAPSLVNCGTSPSRVGNDTAGKITVGTGGPTSCSLQFSAVRSPAPACVASGSNRLISYAARSTNTGLIVESSTSMSSNVISYNCLGYN